MNEPNRHWYRLHWASYVVGVAVGAVVLLCQWEGIGPHWGPRPAGNTRHERSGFGWPVSCGVRTVHVNRAIPEQTTVTYEWYFPGFRVNLVVGLMLIMSTAASCEQALRRPGPFLQIRLRSLFVLVTVTAFLLAFEHAQIDVWDEDYSYFKQGSVIGLYKEWQTIFLPWYLRFPILLALGCAIYETGCLVVLATRGLGRIKLSRDKRHLPTAPAIRSKHD